MRLRLYDTVKVESACKWSAVEPRSRLGRVRTLRTGAGRMGVGGCPRGAAVAVGASRGQVWVPRRYTVSRVGLAALLVLRKVSGTG